jgi:cell shape-determining protein MreC
MAKHIWTFISDIEPHESTPELLRKIRSRIHHREKRIEQIENEIAHLRLLLKDKKRDKTT